MGKYGPEKLRIRTLFMQWSSSIIITARTIGSVKNVFLLQMSILLFSKSAPYFNSLNSCSSLLVNTLNTPLNKNGFCSLNYNKSKNDILYVNVAVDFINNRAIVKIPYSQKLIAI